MVFIGIVIIIKPTGLWWYLNYFGDTNVKCVIFVSIAVFKSVVPFLAVPPGTSLTSRADSVTLLVAVSRRMYLAHQIFNTQRIRVWNRERSDLLKRCRNKKMGAFSFSQIHLKHTFKPKRLLSQGGRGGRRKAEAGSKEEHKSPNLFVPSRVRPEVTQVSGRAPPAN